MSAALAGATRPAGLKIGAMDTILRMSGKPEAVALAKSLGLEGLQVTLGRAPEGDRLPLMDSDLQARFRAESERHKLPLDATYIDILHVNCLKNDPLARKWVQQGIEITKNLRANILMTVFFGKCALLNRTEMDYVADAFKDIAPEAAKAGVILGFENLLSAEDNARVMDRVASKAFKIYYDVGNSTNTGGFDVPKEIRWLGRERICQFHFKDKGYLGEGKVDFPAILDSIVEIGFRGYANLETGSPSGSVEQDTKRNLEYLRRLINR